MRLSRRATAAATLLFAAAGCGERAPPLRIDPGPVPAEHAQGEWLFKADCARCHGPMASGSEIGPPLVHRYYEPNHHADAAFQRAVQFGVQAHHWSYGPMPPVEGLTPPQVEQITGYVRWLQRQAGVY